MKVVLIVYCGLWLGFVMATWLYSTRPSGLNLTHQDVTLDQMRKDYPTDLIPFSNLNRNNCFEMAMVCPPVGPCPCQSLCGSRFKEVTLGDEEEVIYLNQRLSSGTYCLPNYNHPCPRQYGYTLFDGNGKSSCVCKYPSLFGGPYCNDKQACHQGVLLHSQLGYPIDDLTLKDDHVICRCGKDNHGNQMIHYPGDKLNCVSDPCLSLLINTQVKGLTAEGKCDCGDVTHTRVSHIDPTDSTSPCSSCFVQWVDSHHVSLPLRCVSQHGLLHEAPPCKDFKTHVFQCESLPPVSIDVMMDEEKQREYHIIEATIMVAEHTPD